MKIKKDAYVVKEEGNPKKETLSIEEQLELFAEIIVDIYLESDCHALTNLSQLSSVSNSSTFSFFVLARKDNSNKR